MLPECRLQEHLYPVPKFEIEKDNVENFVEELVKYHEQFHDCFVRSETRGSFFDYMTGQFSHLERKSIEPIAVNVKGTGSVRSMQRAVSDAVWHEDKMLHKHQEMVCKEMGNQEGAVIFDESGVVKKGKESAGVGRQYCGCVGKVENSQVGVFMGYTSPAGYCLLDKRLFIPEKWFEDDYEERRDKCGIPEDITFKSKPQLAVEMFRDVVERNALPFKYVLADTLYGNSPEFIDAIDSCVGKIYMVSVPYNIPFWLRPPVVRQETYQYNGEIRSKSVLAENTKAPLSALDFAKNLNNSFWYRRTVSEGTKGPVEYEFTKRSVTLAKDGLPWKNVWLIIRRTIGENPDYSFYISNAPVSTRLKTFVWLSGLRWAIEQCFEECKSELGMDHYEVRKYDGWNRHMLTTMLAHFFLWHIKIELKEDAPAITLPQIRLLLKAVLPMKNFSVKEMIDLVAWIQLKNHKAYLSHRKKKRGENNEEVLAA